MRSAIIGLVIGAWLLQQQANLPSFFFIALLFLTAATAGFLWRRTALSQLRVVLAIVAGVCIGFGWAAIIAHSYLSTELPREWEGKDVTVIGTIDSLPNHFERGVRFNFAVEQVLPIDGIQPVLPKTIALSWYSAFNAENLQSVGAVQPGERWQLTVRLRRPHGNANPHVRVSCVQFPLKSEFAINGLKV